jgi:hypothetical protein
MIRWHLLPFVALAALACSNGPEAIETSGSGGAAPLAQLQQEGGFAGMSSALVVTQGGSATLIRDTPQPDTVSWTLSGTQLTRLEALVASPDFAHTDSTYVPANPCCDRITAALTIYQQGQPPRTIRTLEGADQPDVVEHTVALLRDIIATAPAN